MEFENKCNNHYQWNDYDDYETYQRPNDWQKQGNEYQDYTYHSVRRINPNQKADKNKNQPRPEILFKVCVKRYSHETSFFTYHSLFTL